MPTLTFPPSYPVFTALPLRKSLVSPPGSQGRSAAECRGPSQSMGKDKNGERVGAMAMLHQPWLLGVARRSCRNEAEAEDLVQETITRFFTMFRGKEPPPTEAESGSWLSKTLGNLFIDLCRKQKTHEQAAPELIFNSEAAVEEPTTAPLRSDMISDAQFAEAMGKLTPLKRTVLEMHFAGKKYHEIAKELEIPMGTVGKRIHDAKATLAKLLKQDSPEMN